LAIGVDDAGDGREQIKTVAHKTITIVFDMCNSSLVLDFCHSFAGDDSGSTSLLLTHRVVVHISIA
jgi:hypothetical protein